MRKYFPMGRVGSIVVEDEIGTSQLSDEEYRRGLIDGSIRPPRQRV